MDGIVEDYFSAKPDIKQLHGQHYAVNIGGEGLLSTQDSDLPDGSGRWTASFQMIENYFQEEQVTCPDRLEESVPNPLAVLKGHLGPVHGLQFSPKLPYLLGSGGEQGKMNIWDLAKSSLEIPYNEFNKCDNSDILHLSWSKDGIIATASNSGVTLWDLNSKSTVSDFPMSRGCSIVEWSPYHKDLVLVATGDDSDLPAIQLWDVRNMSKPLKEFGDNSGGIIALSWSLFDENMALACSRTNKTLLLNPQNGEVLKEEDTLGTPMDIKWSDKTKDIFALTCLEGEEGTVSIHRATLLRVLERVCLTAERHK